MDSQHGLFVAADLNVADAGLWIVDVTNNSHQHVDVPDFVAPEGLTAASFSPDGSRIIYSKTRGMGTGSEVWLTDTTGKDRQQIWADQLTTVSSLAYSPDGRWIAFSNLLDSPVPFAAAGLWIIDSNTCKATILTTMDGGHGQLPIWSKDSTELYFVKRDNTENADADYDTNALISSIHAIQVLEGKERTLVAGEQARQIDLAMTPTGDLIFSSNRGGATQIWAVDPLTGSLRQMTEASEPMRHPVFIIG